MTRGAKNWDPMTKPAEAAAGLAAQLDALGTDTPVEFRPVAPMCWRWMHCVNG